VALVGRRAPRVSRRRASARPVDAPPSRGDTVGRPLPRVGVCVERSGDLPGRRCGWGESAPAWYQLTLGDKKPTLTPASPERLEAIDPDGVDPVGSQPAHSGLGSRRRRPPVRMLVSSSRCVGFLSARIRTPQALRTRSTLANWGGGLLKRIVESPITRNSCSTCTGYAGPPLRDVVPWCGVGPELATSVGSHQSRPLGVDHRVLEGPFGSFPHARLVGVERGDAVNINYSTILFDADISYLSNSRNVE
jgi:hypothetical protein